MKEKVIQKICKQFHERKKSLDSILKEAYQEEAWEKPFSDYRNAVLDFLKIEDGEYERYQKQPPKVGEELYQRGKKDAYTIALYEEYLRQVSKEAKDSIEEKIEVLESYCKRNEVFAMAAIQVGIPERIIYFKNTKLEKIEDEEYDEHKIFINPVITKEVGLTSYWEACASCLDYTGLVYRPYHIEVTYQDRNGKKRKETLEGFEATVFAHEYDHLNGILHPDIAKEVRWMNKEERKAFRQIYGYEIFSEEGDYQKLRLEQK